jgi:hypothetical protein
MEVLIVVLGVAINFYLIRFFLPAFVYCQSTLLFLLYFAVTVQLIHYLLNGYVSYFKADNI